MEKNGGKEEMERCARSRDMYKVQANCTFPDGIRHVFGASETAADRDQKGMQCSAAFAFAFLDLNSILRKDFDCDTQLHRTGLQRHSD